MILVWSPFSEGGIVRLVVLHSIRTGSIAAQITTVRGEIPNPQATLKFKVNIYLPWCRH